MGGGGQGTPGFPILARPQFCPDPLPQPLAHSRGLLELGPRGALLARWSSDQDFIREPSVIGFSDLGKLTPAVASCTPQPPSTPALAQMPAHRMALICAWLGAGLEELGVPRGGGFNRTASLFFRPKGLPHLYPTPVPQALASASISLPSHLKQPALRCDTLRSGAWAAGPGDKCSGWGGVSLSRERKGY